MSADGVVAETRAVRSEPRTGISQKRNDPAITGVGGSCGRDKTLGRAEQSAWTALPRSWTLVTNAGPTDERVIALAASGAQPIIAQMGSAPKLAAGTTVSLQR